MLKRSGSRALMDFWRRVRQDARSGQESGIQPGFHHLRVERRLRASEPPKVVATSVQATMRLKNRAVMFSRQICNLLASKMAVIGVLRGKFHLNWPGTLLRCLLLGQCCLHACTPSYVRRAFWVAHSLPQRADDVSPPTKSCVHLTRRIAGFSQHFIETDVGVAGR